MGKTKINNEILKNYLEILCKCYSTGKFDSLFPLLAEDCVFESQWVLQPNTGKAEIIDYLLKKGETLRKHNCCPECVIIELVGNLNPIKDADVQHNGGEARKASVGLLYPDGKLAMFMSQTLNDIENGVVVDLRLNDENLISRIDLCMPELFNFRYYAGPFRVDEEI